MNYIKKLALTINFFDGSEHLQYILKELRDEIDLIICVWQKKSYCGNEISIDDYNEMIRLKSEGLIDELLEFIPDLDKPHREQEAKKRNMGIQFARTQSCTHILNIDTDEYYSKDSFIKAKKYIEEKRIPITYCQYINYYKSFDYYLIYPFKTYVPFIHSTFFEYTFNCECQVPTDPTRRIKNYYKIGEEVLDNDLIIMHHASWIRKNIESKLNNWSAKKIFDSKLIKKAIKRFQVWQYPMDAILLFNVPENKVQVKKLKERLIKINLPF